MGSDTVSAALRETLFVEAKGRCGYCHAPEEFIGMALHVEHLVPRVAGGPTVLYNLWLACVSGNLHKGPQTHAVDPQTGRRVPLFNPRRSSRKKILENLRKPPCAIRVDSSCAGTPFADAFTAPSGGQTVYLVRDGYA